MKIVASPTLECILLFFADLGLILISFCSYLGISVQMYCAPKDATPSGALRAYIDVSTKISRCWGFVKANYLNNYKFFKITISNISFLSLHSQASLGALGYGVKDFPKKTQPIAEYYQI